MNTIGIDHNLDRARIRKALSVFRRRFLFRKAYKIIIGGKTEWINI